MKPTRRNFIKTIAAGILGGSVLQSFPMIAFSNPGKYENGIEIEKGFVVFNAETQKSMEALADTLLPGAKEVGIKDIFMNYAAANPGVAGFFDAGFWNLDTISKKQFKKAFYKLTSKGEKKAVIDHVSVKNRSFFLSFRKVIAEFYYTHPETWKRLAYAGPPQPKGFMDYSLPPTKVK
ncbi:MAG: gluconate 2-dehydrogenase subunit 3 family protein [Thermodesulfobacteriota bacterium]